MAAECPDVLVGGGTVINETLVNRAHKAGARFIVAPGLNEHVVRRSQELGLPVFPGVCTPTEIEAALGLGLTIVRHLVEAHRGRIDADTWDLGAYGTWADGDGKYVDGLVNYTNYDFNTLRSVIFTGFNEANRARHDGDALTAYVGAGWMNPSGEWSWGPTASLQWTSLDLDGFTETGGVSALSVAARDVDSVRSQLGVRATRQYFVEPVAPLMAVTGTPLLRYGSPPGVVVA
jgi:hypothetical protein